MLFLTRPRRETVDALRAQLAHVELNYGPPGLSGGDAPVGFVLDHTRRRLGEGETLYRDAVACLGAFAMFGMPWIDLCWPSVPIEPGQIVATLGRHLGVWSLDPLRILARIDETDRHGFAYGTLVGHLMRGEERFVVERDAGGSVWFEIRAVSAPACWLGRVARPYVRHLQRRFAKDAPAAFERELRRSAEQTRGGRADDVDLG